MIAYVSPPFDFVTAASLLLSRKPAPTIGEIEETYARMLGVRGVVLLPSVRAGIHMVLRAVSGPGGLVVGPAYTCAVVHQAMRASGLRMRFVDAAPRQFSMACDQLASAMEPGCCVIVCEAYGIPTDPNMLKASGELRPAVRILDTALNIPDPVRLGRLEGTDVAMFSLGLGKCMYAGWGGLACFQEEGLAQRIRELRDASARRGTALQQQRNALTVFARVAKRSRMIYGLASAASAAVSLVRGNILGRKEELRSRRAVDVIQEFTAEWSRLPGPFNRKLALHNLHHRETAAGIRRRLAETYVACLKDFGVVQGVDGEALPQSHFPIRVPAKLRPQVQDYLWRRGIDTGRQFPFPESLSPALYLNAAQASAEVLTLPLGEHISPKDVETISRKVVGALQRANRYAPRCG
jgi:dTDP-4-amino-4,6-dideoxygalactose transaminase